MTKQWDVIIVGAGAAGLASAMYTARYGLKTGLIERLMGGAQIINVERIEDFPGFPNGISGAELGPLMQEQAVKAGAEFVMAEATSLTLDNPWRVVTADGESHRAKTVIVAAGSSLRKLGVKGEEELTGSGVSHCATCDGPLFADQVVGVVGGGDAAADEALTLTQYASRVILFHRRDKLRAQKLLQDRLLAHPKIELVWNSVVQAVQGDGRVTGLQVRNVVTGLTNRVELSGLFIYVGLEPNTQFVKGVLKLDNAGHIPVNVRMETEVPGIYAAGDIRQHSVAQLAAAAGDGATAAIMAHHYITSRQWPRE